ncbi:tyrosine decarboxylase MfnA [Methanobrevibacter filiformis]|uniref:Probable L-tyrosine/L-aspartate decarboxylase n=1 Tax=Methanobrevibacter filiformis TaxID=55758 RepID=A0A165YUL1_9EURY|nr:tyrosine decarboxylase MfnA [Methanobrevibacter filiformis]KZX09888.1 histidine decarboxylase [Methanobrevibacter filiformis]
MNQKPMDEDEIFKKLKEFKYMDMDYSSGRILGSMCTAVHPIAKEVYSDFLESNLGDPGLFKGTKAIEDEVIKEIGSFLSLDVPYGNVVTGGTEANLMALHSAYKIAISKGKIAKTDIPEVIVPKSAHFSFKKASEIMRFKLIEANLDKNYKVDIEDVKSNLSSNTIAIVGVAGTTELGMIDPIEELSEIAIKNDIYLHVDAAFGGFLIPFLKDLRYELPNFDFSIPGVSSITIDPHKMGIAPIPSGCIIYREKKYLDVIAVDSPYLTSKKQSTIVGTRLGAPSAATWAMMNHIGRDGYGELANECMINTNYFADALFKEGFNVIVKPELNIVAFNHPKIETEKLEILLKNNGWMVSTASYPKAIRIVVMGHIRHTHLMDLISDLRKIRESLYI